MAKVHVYIDGFNLYYGALKGTPHKWLEAFCDRLLPKDDVEQIRYFTAKISARPQDLQAPQRQETNLRALRTLSKVSIHYGHFLTNSTYLPLAKPPRVGSRKALVIKTEEKGSDVNLAAHALLDGFRGRYETAVIVSNDSDLAEPVRMIRFELGLRVGVANPHPANRRSRELSANAKFFKQIRAGALAASQFPDSLVDAVGRFSNPETGSRSAEARLSAGLAPSRRSGWGDTPTLYRTGGTGNPSSPYFGLIARAGLGSLWYFEFSTRSPGGWNRPGSSRGWVLPTASAAGC